MTIELLAPVDIKKLLQEDEEYIRANQKVFEFFKNETPKHVIYSFINNIHDIALFHREEVYEKVRDGLKEHFDCILEHNPSFFRAPKDEVVRTNIVAWKEMLDRSLTEENFKKIHLTASDPWHNGMNTVTFQLIKDKAYVMPFLYENAYVPKDTFLVDGYRDNPAALDYKVQKLQADALKYAMNHKECRKCPLQMGCVGRNVQNIMMEYDIDECIMPEKFKKLHYGQIKS